MRKGVATTGCTVIRSSCAGAGIQGGITFGASDEHAAFIRDHPVHIRDICVTIYHMLGIDPEILIYDRTDRAITIAHGGHPIQVILE